jgi:hypothetical protein
LATERLIQGEYPHLIFGAKDRKSIDIIVPVYKSVPLTTRCLNSLADHIHEIADSDPRLIVINDSPGQSDVHRMLESFANRHSYVTVLESQVRNRGANLAGLAASRPEKIGVRYDFF